MMSVAVAFSASGVASDQVRIGLWKETNNSAQVVFNNFNSTIAFACSIGGVSVPGSTSTYAHSFAGYSRLGVSITGNQISAWGYNGKTWVCFVSIDLDATLKLTQDMAGWKYTIRGRNDSTTVDQGISAIKITPFGGVGIRDIKFATYENGEPLLVNGDYIVTATVAAPNDTTGRGMYLGVFRFNPQSYKLSQCGRIFFTETISSTKTTFGGASGKILFDRMSRSWAVWVSTYGSPSTVGIAFKVIDFCPLFGTIIIDALTYIPTSRNDMDPVWDGSQYVLPYCRTSTTPAVRRASKLAGLVSATPVDLGPTTVEGIITTKIGGVLYLMGIDRTAHTWRVWRLSDLVEMSPVTVDLSATDVQAAHPNLMAVPVSGGMTKFVNPSFNSPGSGFVTKQGALT